jgi:phosphopantetheinyl transferase (holo-ACP synthase)
MKTAVEWLFEQVVNRTERVYFLKELEQAKEMEQKQLFLASNISAKEAYKAGQQTMHCGCYEISDATTYKEWLYEQFKSE